MSLPSLFLCFPLPSGSTTQPPTSRGEKEHQEGTSWPPTSLQAQHHLHRLPSWLGAGALPPLWLPPLLLPQHPAPSIHEPALFMVSVLTAFPSPATAFSFLVHFIHNTCQGLHLKGHQPCPWGLVCSLMTPFTDPHREKWYRAPANQSSFYLPTLAWHLSPSLCSCSSRLGYTGSLLQPQLDYSGVTGLV